MLWNSYPFMTYPTFSFPPTIRRICPLMNSSPLWTGTKIFPHSFQRSRPRRRNPVPSLNASSLSPFLSGSVSLFHWPFSPLVSISYLVCFPFLFLQLLHIRSAALAHRSVSSFLYRPTHPSISLIGSAMWKPTLSPT